MNEWMVGGLRPGVGVGVAVAIATWFALAACGSPVAATSSERLDTRLVGSLRSAGQPAPQGDGAAVLSSAARATCGGELWQAMVTRRVEPASTRHEAEVSAFTGDARRFVALALGTYCP